LDWLRKKLQWDYLSWARDRWGAVFALTHWSPEVVRVPTGVTDDSHVFLRPGTVDLVVYDEVFRSREYELPVCDAPRLIIDAGAHIGLASVFFALRYPSARIVAIEPDASNYAMLLRHAALYPNIMPIQAGLWNRPCRLRIVNPGADTWSFRVEEAEEGLQAITIDGIAQLFGTNRIDILKIDIEGSEVEVLSSAEHWVDSVRLLIVELHDRFKPGCRAALEKAVERGNWTRSVSGESEVLVRDDPPSRKRSRPSASSTVQRAPNGFAAS
jgi:FkbM family methyltransferase